MLMNQQDFFKGLGNRFWKENDLSDVTYAMCKGSKVFFQFFLDFFFSGELALDAEDAEIAREIDDGKGNRPDFRIETRKGVFYVEVKIWDGGQHFPEYSKSLQEANPDDGGNEEKTKKRLGYIVNYPLHRSGYVVHRWEEIIEKLKRYDYFNDESIRGYVEFVKNVCGLRGNEDLGTYQFHPSDFTNIRRFMGDVLQAIESHRGDGVTPYHRNRAKCFQPNLKMGKVFELANFRGTGKPVWGWLGCYFNETRPEIVVQFENQRGWGDLVCQEYKAPHKQESSVYFDDYDNALYFYMVETDKDINAFLGRVLSAINEPYEPEKVPAFPTEGQFKKYDFLLSMRRFPKAVKRVFFDGINDIENECLIQVTGQDDSPFNRSHVTFQIHMVEDETDISGWVGVDYGGDNAPQANPELQFRFAFGGEPPNIIAPPTVKEDLKSWAAAFRSQLKEKLRERACRNPS